MLSEHDNQEVFAENEFVELAVSTVIGDRTEQQDCFGYKLGKNDCLFVLCDGMGGYNGGKIAGKTSTEIFLNEYESIMDSTEISDILKNAAVKADARVSTLTDSKGELLNGGSTAVVIVLKNNSLQWLSVGDSRAYLLRNEEFVQFTLDHNYATVIKEQLSAGIIDEEKYKTEQKKSEALVSFIGIDDLRLIDHSKAPLGLKSADRIVVMSDGLYKILSDEEIYRIIGNFSNINEALYALEIKAKSVAKKRSIKRDNMTVAIIKVR